MPTNTSIPQNSPIGGVVTRYAWARGMAPGDGPPPAGVVVVEVACAPGDGELRHRVLAALRSGAQTITLDLAPLRRIDAAGLGELVRIHNVATAAHARIRLVNVTRRIRRMLRLAGLLELFSEPTPRPLPCTRATPGTQPARSD